MATCKCDICGLEKQISCGCQCHTSVVNGQTVKVCSECLPKINTYQNTSTPPNNNVRIIENARVTGEVRIINASATYIPDSQQK
jgi:hypothetical protein